MEATVASGRGCAAVLWRQASWVATQSHRLEPRVLIVTLRHQTEQQVRVVSTHIPLATTRRTHSTKFCRVFAFMIVLCFRGVFEGARRNGTIRLAQFNHFRGEKHNCLLPLPLSWCYACCVCCASCVFRSGASESASGSLPTRSTRFAGAKRFTPIIPPPIFFFAMLQPVYSATNQHWFPMELKRAYSNNNCLLPMRLRWCYIAHVCWVFCVLSFFASDVASGAVLRVLRALQHVFVPTFIGRSAFMVQEPCLTPVTRYTCSMVAEGWEAGRVEASGETEARRLRCLSN